MHRILKKVAGILLFITVSMNWLIGCKNRVGPERLMSEVAKNLTVAQSSSNSLYMNVEFEDVIDTMKISMDMDMENTTNPEAGHAKGKARVDVSGTKVESDIEIYQVLEGEDIVTYSSMYNQWSREASKHKEKSGFGGSLFQNRNTSMKSFRIAKEAVKVGGKECHQVYGDVSGKEFMDFMGVDIVKVFDFGEFFNEKVIESLKVPITVDIYKKEMLPARVFIDMTDVMNELYDKNGKRKNVNDFTIKLEYTGFNKREKIEVPPEVKTLISSKGLIRSTNFRDGKYHCL